MAAPNNNVVEETIKITCALAFKVRLSDRSHFTLALSLPSVSILPKSINYISVANVITLKFNMIAKQQTFSKWGYLGVYKVGTKLVIGSRDFDDSSGLGRNLHWSHKHTDQSSMVDNG